MTIAGKLPLDYMITTLLLSFSLSQLNLVLTTVILVLTAFYWLQKNYRLFKGKDENKQGFN